MGTAPKAQHVVVSRLSLQRAALTMHIVSRPRPMRTQEPGVEVHERGWGHESGRPWTGGQQRWLGLDFVESPTLPRRASVARATRLSKEWLVQTVELRKLAVWQPHFAIELQAFERQYIFSVSVADAAHCTPFQGPVNGGAMGRVISKFGIFIRGQPDSSEHGLHARIGLGEAAHRHGQT